MSSVTIDRTARLGVRIPPSARGPFDVYVDGVVLREGDDFEELPGAIALKVPVEPRCESRWRDLVSTIAGIGFYRQGDYIDIAYRGADGRPVAATLPVTRIGGGAEI
jgi:hypothetical protein